MSDTPDRPRPRPRPTPTKPSAKPVAKRAADLGTTVEHAVRTARPPLPKKTSARPTPPPSPPQLPPPPLSPTSRRRRFAVVGWIGAAVAVVLIAANAALFLLYRSLDDNVQAAKEANSGEVVKTYTGAVSAAKKLIPTVLSYDYKTLDADITRASAGLTGRFKNAYTSLLRNAVAPEAKKKKVSTKATQVGASVINADDRKRSVSVLVFIDQETTSNGQKSVAGSRVQVTMQKVGTRWLVANFTPI